MSGGVVYAGGTTPGNLGRYGAPITVASGAVIPPGVYLATGAVNINAQGTSESIAGGMVVSDGTNATAGAAGTLVPLGAGPQAPWPWPSPWPIGIT